MATTTAQPTSEGVIPWPDDAMAHYVEKGYWDGRSMTEHIYACADRAPHALCLVDGDLHLNYAEVVSRVDGAAVRLAELGLRADDRIVIQLPNCWELVVLTLACMRLGAPPVMALTAHRRQELAGVASKAQARALVVPDTIKDFDHQAMARSIADDTPVVRHVIVLGDEVRPGGVDARALCQPADDPAAARARFDAAAPGGGSVATFLLSGGTTGPPKLIARTHNDYGYMARRAGDICGIGPETVYLAVLPLGHGFPMSGPGVLGVLMAGGTVVIAPSPAPEGAFEAIEREGVTITSVVPAAVQRWLEHRETEPERDLSSLRLLQVGGSRLADEVARRVTPTLGCTLQQVFGMSEGLLCLTRPDDPEDVLLHTQGRPVCDDDEIMLVDDEGNPVPAGEPGVLLTRGPYTPRGYYRGGDLNGQSFVGDGWYRTGDIVRQRPDGNLIVEGRDKDVINRGGEKISAEEVENFAYGIDGVSLAAAVGMPDTELGERICLYVVAQPGTYVALSDVQTAMRSAGVARFKLPERLVLVDALPFTTVGKVDKKALRADITQRDQAA